MKLPAAFENMKEWTLVGPLGPRLPSEFLSFPVLAVDGGASFAEKVDLWVGDGDSAIAEVKCSHKYEFPPEKSQSDLALALSLLTLPLPLKIHAWGFSGGRKDHEWLNAGEILHFLERHPGSEVNLYAADGAIEIKFLAAGTWSFSHQGLFSLAALRAVNVKMIGACAYPILQHTQLPPLSSLGLSNVASGTIELSNQGPVMLIFPKEQA